MLKHKLYAVAGAAAAAGALALALGGVAQAMADPVTVTASPASFSGEVGNPISPVTVSISDSLTGATTVVSDNGTLPAGVTLGSNDVISGTPSAAGSGSATITATATLTDLSPSLLSDLTESGLADACSYTLNGPSSYTVSVTPNDPAGSGDTTTVTVSGLTVNPDGSYSYTIITTVTAGDGATVSTSSVSRTETAWEEVLLPGNGVGNTYTVTETCVGSTAIPYAIGANSAPSAPPASSAPSSGGSGSTVPTGGVQTGGGKPLSNPFVPIGGGIAAAALLTLAGAALIRRSHRQQS
jgi:large repetitive protein